MVKNTLDIYPFQLKKAYKEIIANLESAELFLKYHSFFKANGYEGNGYCWEGHIIQILEKLNSELLAFIDFDSVTEKFQCSFENSEAMQNFINIVVPIFSNMNELQYWVSTAARDRIDD